MGPRSCACGAAAILLLATTLYFVVKPPNEIAFVETTCKVAGWRVLPSTCSNGPCLFRYLEVSFYVSATNSTLLDWLSLSPVPGEDLSRVKRELEAVYPANSAVNFCYYQQNDPEGGAYIGNATESGNVGSLCEVTAAIYIAGTLVLVGALSCWWCDWSEWVDHLRQVYSTNPSEAKRGKRWRMRHEDLLTLSFLGQNANNTQDTKERLGASWTKTGL